MWSHDGVNEVERQHLVIEVPGLGAVEDTCGQRLPHPSRKERAGSGNEPHGDAGVTGDRSGRDRPCHRKGPVGADRRRFKHEQPARDHRSSEPRRADLGHLNVRSLEATDEAAAFVKDIDHKYGAVASPYKRIAGKRRPADHRDRHRFGQCFDECVSGRVVANLDGAPTSLGPSVGGGQHPGAQPPQWPDRQMALNDAATRRHKAGRVDTETDQTPGRFPDQDGRLGTRCTGHVPEPLDRMHFGDDTRWALTWHAVAQDPSGSIELAPLGGAPKMLTQWLTTFHLASVVIDPYTNESAWILPTAVRLLRAFSGADVKVNFVVTAGPDDARAFLGPYAKEFLVFTDPERELVRSLGLARLPAFAFIQTDGSLGACAEGWSPDSWKAVCNTIAEMTAWSAPNLPTASDPAPFAGSIAV